jgi:hypothetical protein
MIIKDNFLDKNLYDKVLNDKNFFPESMGGSEKIAADLNSYHYEKSTCFAPYMFWDGWWRSPTNTLKKQVIQTIWKDNLSWPVEDILGFEYWTRTYLPGQYLDIHVDEDTFLYSEQKIFKGPIYGCVYYAAENNDGGFLEVHQKSLTDGLLEVLEKENIKEYISPEEKRDKVKYKGNRLVFFDSGHIIHNTTPAKSGIRQVMVVNVWHKDSPPLALSNGSFFYE